MRTVNACDSASACRRMTPVASMLLLLLLIGKGGTPADAAPLDGADWPSIDAAYAHYRQHKRDHILGPTSGYAQGHRSGDFLNIERAITNDGRNLSCVVEGDIRICDDDSERNSDRKPLERAARSKRQVVNPKYYDIWSRKIKYAVDVDTYRSPGAVTAAIRAALNSWESRTCLRFVEIDLPSDPNDDSIDYLRVHSGRGCWSYIGKIGGPQELSLAETGCVYTGVIMHEFGHALGLVHEQSRPDRDASVTVLANNVVRGYVTNFFKSPCPTIQRVVPFDIESVMEYGLSDFTQSQATIRPKSNEYATLAGNRASATHYNFKAISSLYQCQDDCPNVCQNDGYALKDSSGACTCVCPYGLGGPTCSTYDRTSFACGGVITLAASGAPYALTASASASGGGKCAWLFKAPQGSIVSISFSRFNVASGVTKCSHYVEVRKNLIGQSGPQLYCGKGIPDNIYSRNDYESNAALVIFDYTSPAASASSFAASVSSYFDGCLGDPCRGAPCQSSSGSRSYTCVLPYRNVMCGFESVTSPNCSVVRMDGAGNGSCDGYQRTWEVIDAGSTTVPTTEGAYFISTDAREDEGTTSRGSFRIIPHDFKGAPRCLKFKFYMESAAAGTLNVYRSVNGNLGQPVGTFSATTTSMQWRSVSLNVNKPTSSQDLIEIVFEAVHVGGGGDSTIIAVDDIRYAAGACQTGPCASDPCGTNVCVENPAAARSSQVAPYTCLSTYPDADASCSFEDWEDCKQLVGATQMPGDLASWVPYKWAGPGWPWPYSTGASGPATGLTYLYAKLYNQLPKARMRVRLLPYLGNRCLVFKFVMNGVNCGALNVYRAVNGNYNSPTLLWSAKGNQGPLWLQAAVTVSVADLPSNASVEVIIEAVNGDWINRVAGYYATDIALDELRYLNGTCNRFAGTFVTASLSVPTRTPRCSWVWKINAWAWVCS